MSKKKKFTIKENISSSETLSEQDWVPSPWEIDRQKKEEDERNQQKQDELQLPNPNDEAPWYWDDKSSKENEDEEKRGIEIVDLYGEGKLRLRDLLSVRPALVSPHLFGFNGKAPRRLSEGVELNERGETVSIKEGSEKVSQKTISKLVFEAAPKTKKAPEKGKSQIKTPDFSKMKQIGKGSSRIVYESSEGVYKVPRPDRKKWGTIQNKMEAKIWKATKSPVLAKVLDHAPDFSWLLMEKLDVSGPRGRMLNKAALALLDKHKMSPVDLTRLEHAVANGASPDEYTGYKQELAKLVQKFDLADFDDPSRQWGIDAAGNPKLFDYGVTATYGGPVVEGTRKSRLHEQSNLNEGGYSKLMRSLTGQERNISSIGIVTAENPFAKELPPEENKKRNKMLAQSLRQAGYGFYQIQGKYGNVEKPLVIPNISKDDLLFLGKKFEQESVIFVERQEDGQMKAELLYTDGSGNATEPRSVVLPVAQDQDDFYSIYKGRKFVIPFFNDLFSGATMSGGRVNYPEKTEES